MQQNLIRPNDKRAKAAIASLYANGIASLVVCFSSLVNSYFNYQFNNDDVLDGTLLDFNNLLAGFGWLAYVATFIISVVYFIMWFRRAYYNMGVVTNNMSYSDAAAAYSWFIPFLNLFRPYQMMKELFMQTDYVLSENDKLHVKPLGTSMVSLWWGLWIFHGVLSYFENKVSDASVSFEDLTFSSLFEAFVLLFNVVLAYVTIRMVKSYVPAQEKLEELYNVPAQPSPADDSNSFYG